MSEACTCSSSWHDGDDGYDRDCPSHGVLASELDGWDRDRLSRTVLAVANYYNQRLILGEGQDAWDALTLRIWAAQRQALDVFDRLEDDWGLWISALPCDGPFDWMGWRPWEMMRAWIVPPDPFLEPLQQIPRYWNPPPFPRIPNPLTDRSRWTLPDYDGLEEPPKPPPLTDDQSRWLTDVGSMSNDTFRKLLADSTDDAVTLRLWPGEDEEAVATRREALSQYWGDSSVEARQIAECAKATGKTFEQVKAEYADLEKATDPWAPYCPGRYA